MRVPKSFIKNKLFEIGRTVIVKPRRGFINFYHKKLTWWINIYGFRLHHVGYYIMVKKICF